MRKLSADYIFTGTSAPMKNAIIVLDDSGRVRDIQPSPDEEVDGIERFKGIITPGFINTHCHLELSHMKGIIPERTGLVEFIKNILAKREASLEEIHSAIETAEKEMIENGIVAVGDISNVKHTFLQKYQNNLFYHTFVEIFNLVPSAAEETFRQGKELYDGLEKNGQSASIVPHAPYTVSMELLRMIDQFNSENGLPSSMHNQETEDENLLFINKTGALNDFYKQWGFDISFFKPTGMPSLESVLPAFEKNCKLLLVHNTMCNLRDIQFAHNYSQNIYWCFNPNANLYIENQLPDYDLFIKENAKCTIGTDSLASNWQLSVLEEIKVISAHSPEIPLETLIKWATINGAEILGFDDSLGSIEVGKRPGLNLIENVNLERVKLTKESRVRKLV